MESNRPFLIVGFQALQARLLAEVNNRVDNGLFTERALARMTGISQPHLHNILKGARKLSPQTADVLLAYLGLSVSMLLSQDEFGAVPRKPAAFSSALPSAADRAS